MCRCPVGEPAKTQIAEDFRRMFGGEWTPEDFDDDLPPKKTKPYCPMCGKKFNMPTAVDHHLRDKHLQKAEDKE